MNLGDVGAQALANLTRHKLRTVLTLLGVAVGVATLTVLVSLGEGLRRLIASQVDNADLATRVDVLPKGFKDRLMGRGPDVDAAGAQKLTDEVVRDLAKIPGVVAAYPNVHTMLGVELGGEIFPFETEGFPPQAVSKTHQDALLVGAYWTTDDEAVVVAPSSLLQDLGLDPLKAVGKSVFFMHPQELRRYDVTTEAAGPPPTTSDGKTGPPPVRRRFTRPEKVQLLEARIVGVYDSEEFGLAGRRFHTPLAFGKKLLDESGMRGFGDVDPDAHRSLVVKARSRVELKDVRAAIELKGFDTFAIEDALRWLNIIFIVIDVMLGFFGMIGLVVSFFGIANTMVMAVLERTREIGVFKALGARDRDVRRIFLLEAAAIGVLGGALGVVVGWLVGALLNAVASYALRDALGGRPVEAFFVPGWLALLSISLSTLVAGVAGLYPAWRAARLDPVVSLRME